MAIKKISEFTSATPTASDMILFEQSGAGKSTTIGDAVNTCSLTYEEIMASTDLSGKVASANSIKILNQIVPKLLEDIKGNVADNFENGTIYYAWFHNNSNLPYKDTWGTIMTQRSGYVGNQQAFCNRGIACRHFENGTWTDWKKVSLL